MPSYEYRCECGGRDERLCRADAKPRVQCPCGKRMTRIFPVPAIRTNATFMAGRDHGVLDNNPLLARKAMAKARQQGVGTGQGNHYSTQLSQWFSSKDDVRGECERRGWGCEGAVQTTLAPAAESDGKYHVADDLVEEHTQRAVERDHGGQVGKKQRQQIKRELAVSLAGNQD